MHNSVELEALGDEPGIATPTDSYEFAGGPVGGLDDRPGGGLVQIAYCHETRVSHSWHSSMLLMYAYDKSVGPDIIHGAPIMVSCSGPHGLVEGRNDAVRIFLDETEAEWLLWVDTDMGFAADAAARLLEAADPETRPVVGGLCFAMKHVGPDGKGGFNVAPLPTIFGLAKDKNGIVGFMNRSTYPPNTLMQCAGTGSAFIIIHRTVLEDIRIKHGPSWYDLISYEDGRHISEDLSFCWRVGDVGKPIFVHTGVGVTHHKEVWLSEADYVQPIEDPIFKSKTPKLVMDQ